MSYCCQGQALGEDHDANCGHAPRPRPPVPGKANFHVAVAMKLRMRSQDPDKLLDEIDRLKRVEDEYLGLRQQMTVHKRAWPCGCLSMGSGSEWVHQIIDPASGEVVFGACREGHIPGQLFDAWCGQQQQASDEATYAEQSDAYRHSTEG